MSKKVFALSAVLVATGVGLVVPSGSVQAQGRRAVEPEHQLLGVRLGRPFLEVIRTFGTPTEIQTVALAAPTDVIPDLEGGGGGAPGMGGMGMGMPGAPGMGMGMPGMSGSGGGNRPFGGGSPFGGSPMGAPGMGGIPVLPPAGGGNGPGGPGMGMGMPGAPGAPGSDAGAGGQQLPEYSNAILWIYADSKTNVRKEFLINEDGRVAQISVAAPAGKVVPRSATARGISLNSDFGRVMEQYGNPERHRMLPGFRFYEAYYSKNYHAAFTFDTSNKMKVVRITIALAD